MQRPPIKHPAGMRLLNVRTYELAENLQGTQYAILSHRWYDQEITFRTLDPAKLKDLNIQTPQLEKIRGACARARADRLDWIWMDSCCIDRDSSEQLRRTINSMFQFYQHAAVCYTHLSDVATSESGAGSFQWQETEQQPGLRHSEWFSRGWTLQELLAPRKMIFFDRCWRLIGTKTELASEISRITGIETGYLTGAKDFRSASIATRLSWQAGRKTTEIEDIAYSLLGILDVQLVPMYSEGRQASQRLQVEIIRTNNDESIFAWTSPTAEMPSHSRSWASDQWGLLAPSPDYFAYSRDITIDRPSIQRPPGEIQTIPEGVKFPMPNSERSTMGSRWLIAYLVTVWTIVIPAGIALYSYYKHTHREEFRLTLNCRRKDESGRSKAVQVFLCRDTKGDLIWRRSKCAALGLADKLPRSAYAWTAVTVLQPTGVNWPID